MLKNVLNSWCKWNILCQFDKTYETNKNFITTNTILASTYKKHESNKYSEKADKERQSNIEQNKGMHTYENVYLS